MWPNYDCVYLRTSYKQLKRTREWERSFVEILSMWRGCCDVQAAVWEHSLHFYNYVVLSVLIKDAFFCNFIHKCAVKAISLLMATDHFHIMTGCYMDQFSQYKRKKKKHGSKAAAAAINEWSLILISVSPQFLPIDKIWGCKQRDNLLYIVIFAWWEDVKINGGIEAVMTKTILHIFV